MLDLLAQTDVGIPTGAIAGWASFFTSGGVLGWFLFKYLPRREQESRDDLVAKDQMIASKDKAITDLIASRDRVVNELIAAKDLAVREIADKFTRTVTDLMAGFKEELQAERDLSERRHAECMAGHAEVLESTKENGQAINGLAHEVGTHRQVIEARLPVKYKPGEKP